MIFFIIIIGILLCGLVCLFRDRNAKSTIKTYTQTETRLFEKNEEVYERDVEKMLTLAALSPDKYPDIVGNIEQRLDDFTRHSTDLYDKMLGYKSCMKNSFFGLCTQLGKERKLRKRDSVKQICKVINARAEAGYPETVFTAKRYPGAEVCVIDELTKILHEEGLYIKYSQTVEEIEMMYVGFCKTSDKYNTVTLNLNSLKKFIEKNQCMIDILRRE